MPFPARYAIAPASVLACEPSACAIAMACSEVTPPVATVCTSAGAGTRVVTSSGFVYRFDVATGQEGPEVILFVDYPWGTIGQ